MRKLKTPLWLQPQLRFQLRFQPRFQPRFQLRSQQFWLLKITSSFSSSSKEATCQGKRVELLWTLQLCTCDVLPKRRTRTELSAF